MHLNISHALVTSTEKRREEKRKKSRQHGRQHRKTKINKEK